MRDMISGSSAVGFFNFQYLKVSLPVRNSQEGKKGTGKQHAAVEAVVRGGEGEEVAGGQREVLLLGRAEGDGHQEGDPVRVGEESTPWSSACEEAGQEGDQGPPPALQQVE